MLPVILDFFLPVSTGLDILGEEDGPIIWLQFWASYIPALAAASASIIALYNEKMNRQRDHLEHKINTLKIDYLRIEKEILDFEKIHSVSNAVKIASCCKSDIDEALELQRNWFRELSSVSVLFLKYDDSNEYHSILSKINMKMVDSCIKMGEKIDLIKRNGCVGEIEELASLVNNIDKETLNDYITLFREGFNYLEKFKTQIDNYNSELSSLIIES